jgi:hypothetical protein
VSLWAAIRAPVLEIADQFILLGIDRDRRLAGRQRRLHPIIDVAELCIAIRMTGPFARLAVGLQAVIELMQQFADHRTTDLVAHIAQAFG